LFLLSFITGLPPFKAGYRGFARARFLTKTTGGSLEVIDETFRDSASFKDAAEGIFKEKLFPPAPVFVSFYPENWFF
jgi:hypothetical protein